jgi:CcmD family protein
MWRTIHPILIDTKGIHISTPMLLTLVISLGALCMLFFVLLRTRVRLENTRSAYQELYLLFEKQRFKPGVKRWGMENLGFLFAAYSAVWVVFFLYVFSLWRRQRQVGEDVLRLKDQMEKRQPGPLPSG